MKFLTSLIVSIAMGSIPPALAASDNRVEATIVTAATQVSDNYVDVVEMPTLFTHGLNGLADMGRLNVSQKRALDAAMRAEAKAIGFKPQADILISEIMRFRAGSERDAALTAALGGMMAGLDKSSRLILPSELKPPPASVGLELTVKDGALTVVRPLPGGPGEKAGIRAGDVLTAIDGRRTAGLPLAEAVGLLRGASGTDLALGIARPGTSAPLTFRPVRGPVQAPPSLGWETQGRVAVVRIGAFSSTTQAGLRDSLGAAAARAEAPLEGIVLDLRGNAGGLLDVAEQIGGMLLPAGTEIAKLSGRTPNNARRLVSGQGDVTSGQPIVVIVDARTAAGAEIVAAALQEHGRALVVGQKTAGAGTIQTLLPLPGGQGGLLLTTARIYRPKGTTLDGDGVTPDLVLDPQIGLLPSRSGTGAKPDDETTKQIAAAISMTPDGTDRAKLAAIKLIDSAHKPARPQKP